MLKLGWLQRGGNVLGTELRPGPVLGADAVFDYQLANVRVDIRAHTGNGLRLVLDCITTPDATRPCYAAIGRAGWPLCRARSLQPGRRRHPRRCALDRVLGPELIGEDGCVA